MSVQPSIASYFGKRKRLVGDNGHKVKLLKTETSSVVKSASQPVVANWKSIEKNDCYPIKSTQKQNDKVSVVSKNSQKNNDKSKQQMDIREALKKCQESRTVPASQMALQSPVKFQLMGSLSPVKKNAQKNKINENIERNDGVESTSSSEKKDSAKTNAIVRSLNFSEKKNDCSTDDIIKSAHELVSKIRETKKKLTHEDTEKKQLSLKEIKDKINRSSKLSELKKSITKINRQADELIELEKKKLIGTQPKLSKFKSFDVKVPVSPVKHSQRSPCKPAYERFAGLVETPTTALPLPFGYQKLYDFFCAVDAICSMITNRGETLTFEKLKPAVEEMTRKTFTSRHLGQIAAVFPEAFSFHQEKLRNYGSTSKADKYELVITPLIPKNSDTTKSSKEVSANEENVLRASDKKAMTLTEMKKRKEIFHRNLLEKTKDYHEDFLKTLNPPLTISRSDLKRWHPNFMVDFVPDIKPTDLPQPPNSERATSAKQVLERAKAFLSSNARLQKALEAAANETEKNENPPASSLPEVAPDIKAKVDARLKDPFQGIPKSLLEKVRAKQAAKALEAMQMTPEQERETQMYTRLNDMARIIRMAFVTEQKAVIPMDGLTERVQFSCNRHIGLKEIEAHIRLLIRLLPEWLSIVNVRNLDFVKTNRNVDIAIVMKKLSKIVEEKKKGGKS